MKYLALLLLLPLSALAQTVDVKRAGPSACECQNLDGTRISGHTSDLEAIDACADLAFADGQKKRLTCSYELSVTRPTPPAQTASVTLNWEAPTKHTDGRDLTGITGYRVRYGTDPDALTQTVDVGNVLTTSIQLAPGTYYFSVMAYTATEQGQWSNTVSRAL